MKTLMKGQSVAVRYKDPDFNQIIPALKQPSAGGATLLAFTGVPKMQMQSSVKELARMLGKPVIDMKMQNISGKFIGETEKNLSRLLQRAQASGAILLFDEADALFGKRTGVKDSHDKYANLETNYLLEKLEKHRGLVIALFQSGIEAERKKPGLQQLVVRFPPL